MDRINRDIAVACCKYFDTKTLLNIIGVNRHLRSIFTNPQTYRHVTLSLSICESYGRVRLLQIIKTFRNGFRNVELTCRYISKITLPQEFLQHTECIFISVDASRVEFDFAPKLHTAITRSPKGWTYGMSDEYCRVVLCNAPSDRLDCGSDVDVAGEIATRDVWVEPGCEVRSNVRDCIENTEWRNTRFGLQYKNGKLDTVYRNKGYDTSTRYIQSEYYRHAAVHIQICDTPDDLKNIVCLPNKHVVIDVLRVTRDPEWRRVFAAGIPPHVKIRRITKHS